MAEVKRPHSSKRCRSANTAFCITCSGAGHGPGGRGAVLAAAEPAD